MTTPSILADTAQDARVDRSGAVRSIKGTATVPNATAADTIIGLVRFQKGFSLQHLALTPSDMDAGTTVQLDVGFVYDDNVTYTDNPDAFFDGSTAIQTGAGIVWPVASGLLVGSGFVAEADGYIVAQIKVDPTEAGGTIAFNALFSYNA